MTLDRLAPAIFVLLWSTGWVMAKYADIYADPLTFLVLRYLFATVLFIGFCFVTGAAWPKTWGMAGHAVISGVFLHGLYLGAVWWAIGQGVPAAISGIIAGLQPLMTAVAAPALIGEKLSGQQKVGLTLGFLGIALAVIPKVLTIDTGMTPIQLFPVFINVLGMAAATYGHDLSETVPAGRRHPLDGGAAICRRPDRHHPRRVSSGGDAGHLERAAVCGSRLGGARPIDGRDCPSALPSSAAARSPRRPRLIYLVPPLAAIQAWLLFDEALTLPMIAGTVIAVAGVYLTNRKPVAVVA